MKILLLIALIATAQSVFAHRGGLDSNGGHNDRKNGGYHCHNYPCGSAHTNKVTKQVRYNRKSWPHWSDFDNDCMNTRHEILLVQASGPVKKSPDGCYVSTGLWNDPFSGKTFNRASDLDVDHIIPLKWAHDHGGAWWSKKNKERFANDPVNLLAVDDGLNQAKGAKGPTEWLPPNHKFRCEYLSMWRNLLARYKGLEMTVKESRVFVRQLKACD